MSELTTLARPYAVAAFKRAKETGRTQQWSDQLAFLSAVMADGRMQQAVANPKARRESLAKSFMTLCEGQLDDEGQNYLRLLLQNHRLDLVATIASLFEQYRADDEGYVDVQVKSAYELTTEETEHLSKTLNAALGKTAKIVVEVDRDLIGGVFIRAGDRVIDASVRGQIERLAKKLRN
jgi:F-type H+-transporting ATPase subunit delta